jgi:general stress protein CsbA
MIKIRPYFYLSLALTIILFGLFIAVGYYGSPSDVFFLVASLIAGGISYVLFRKDKENKDARRH